MVTEERIAAVERKLGVVFNDKGYLLAALALSPRPKSGKQYPSQRALAYCGDALLLRFVRCLMVGLHPQAWGMYDEWARMFLSNRAFELIVRDLGLAAYVRKERRQQGEPNSTHAAGTVLEAITEAIARDQGLDAARMFLNRTFIPRIDLIIESMIEERPAQVLDFLGRLRLSAKPVYSEPRVVEETGHGEVVEITVTVGTAIRATATGLSDREARNAAARQALDLLSDLLKAAEEDARTLQDAP